jgi:hypothetical protein
VASIRFCHQSTFKAGIQNKKKVKYLHNKAALTMQSRRQWKSQNVNNLRACRKSQLLFTAKTSEQSIRCFAAASVQ